VENPSNLILNHLFSFQMSMTLAVADGHLVNMGKMIEEMEGKLRNSLDQVTVSHHTSKKEQFHI
jgi:hypothetical protein